jgi:hypothetical protein
MGVKVTRDLNIMLADGQTRVNVGDLVDFISSQVGGSAPPVVPQVTAEQVNAYIDSKMAAVEATVEQKLAEALAGHGPQPDAT